MKIRFLGTGASEGVPALFCKCMVCENARKKKGRDIRSRIGFLVDESLMIDFSPDTYWQATANSLDLSAVKTLLITHTHSDHFYPEDLLARNDCSSFVRTNYDLQIYGNESVVNRFESMNPPQGVLDCTKMNRVENQTVLITNGYKITPLKAEHMTAEDCLNYLIQKDGKTYLHIVDSGYPLEETFAYLSKNKISVDAISIDCTFGSMLEEFYGHMNLWQNIKVKRRLDSLGVTDQNTKVVLTHFSHWNKEDYKTLQNRVDEYGFCVAYDGMTIEI